jgi:hypothetical protein
LDKLQFYGSHNSYKTAMPAPVLAQLQAVNPAAATSLEYWHVPFAEQLDLGLRVLELDFFYDPGGTLFGGEEFGSDGEFPVLHVQNLDTGSNCPHLRACLIDLLAWSDAHPTHEPLMVSFNAKTERIDRPEFIVPRAFDAAAWVALDKLLRSTMQSRLIAPADVHVAGEIEWPQLGAARGHLLFVLDEGEAKIESYLAAVGNPVIFVNLPETDPRAAIIVANDPIGDAARIRRLVRAGYLVRTRADADTLEARRNDTTRRDAAFASGAHFVSTDYYYPARHFGSDYVVRLPGGGAVRCNPVTAAKDAPEGC